MEGSQSQISNAPVQVTPPLQNPQPTPQTIQGTTSPQETQVNTPPSPSETESIKKKHSWISYVLMTLAIIFAISNFFGPISLLSVFGSIYYLVTAFELFKKPKIGYIMFGVAVLLFISLLRI